jgi:hypothetical protein
MKLMRKLTYHSAMHSYVIHAQHIAGKNNGIANSFSLSDEKVLGSSTTSKQQTNAMPASYRGNDGLTSRLDNLWYAALNKSTRVTYMSAFKCFQRFLILNGLNGDNNKCTLYRRETIVILRCVMSKNTEPEISDD